MSDIDVIIPTLRRPEHLTRALRSVFSQLRVAELIDTVVIVDNSPEGSSAALVDALRACAPIPLRYVHAPHPGVATARNAGLAASGAALVAFLDDDEEAPPHWLGSLRRDHLALGSAVTFGPVRGVSCSADPGLRAYLDRFFSREGPAETGLLQNPFGCGNSIMTRRTALPEPAPFDAGSDLTGGEDDRLFARLRARGLSFGWAADAWVYEHAPPHRSTLSYALKRGFCYGQGPSQLHARAGRWGGLALTMAVGAGQATTYALAALACLCARRRSAAVRFLDRAVRGAGKIFWKVKIELYGLAISPTADPVLTEKAEIPAAGSRILAVR